MNPSFSVSRLSILNTLSQDRSYATRYLFCAPAVRKGAFAAGGNASFTGKILYRHCRKPVYTPSDWDPSLAERSAQLPLARLVLEFVYGYQGGARPLININSLVVCSRIHVFMQRWFVL